MLNFRHSVVFNLRYALKNFFKDTKSRSLREYFENIVNVIMFHVYNFYKKKIIFKENYFLIQKFHIFLPVKRKIYDYN